MNAFLGAAIAHTLFHDPRFEESVRQEQLARSLRTKEDPSRGVASQERQERRRLKREENTRRSRANNYK